MLSGIVTLLLFTVIGNFLNDGLGIPAPGPVIGLILLVTYIQLKVEIDEPLDKVSQFCIRYLAALFEASAKCIQEFLGRQSQIPDFQFVNGIVQNAKPTTTET